jgi:selenide,water dikinase
MLTLNDIGAELADVDAVRSITDVTGFGLLGHLTEMCEASGVSAEIEFSRVPMLAGLDRYIERGTFPGGTSRNFSSYGHKLGPLSDEARNVLCDPQTSGGLLVAVDPDDRDSFLSVAQARGLDLDPFGRMTTLKETRVSVD